MLQNLQIMDNAVTSNTHKIAMRRLSDNSIEQFSIKLLDENLQHRFVCPTPPISSKNHSFLFLLRGEVLIEITNKQFLILANECITISANTNFTIKYFKDCYGYMGSFNNDFLCTPTIFDNSYKNIAFLQTQPFSITKFDFARSGFIQVLLERIFDETISVPQNTDIIKSNLNSFLIEIAVEVEKNCIKPLKTPNETCNKFMEMVFMPNQQKKSVAEYADILNISADYLNKLVKNNTGKSVSEWIEASLMLTAKMMLRNTNLSMSEIANNLGFTDPSYFTRRFKLNEKISPSEYRRIVNSNV